jgi:hypothetical protein
LTSAPPCDRLVVGALDGVPMGSNLK